MRTCGGWVTAAAKAIRGRGVLALAAFLFAALTSLAGLAGAAEPLRIGTGQPGGLYLPLGQALAEHLQRTDAPSPLSLAAVATSGSVENINGLLAGKFQLALAQSDDQFQAVEGRAEWNRAPQTRLRFLCGLGTEAVTLVATVESGIKTPADLKGKRVGIGAPESGSHYNAVQVLAAFGIDSQTGIIANEDTAAACAQALQVGTLDAFFYTAGHPNETVRNACSGAKPVRIVTIAGEGIELLLEANPYLNSYKLDAKKLYPACANDDAPVATFGVVTTLLCRDDLDDATVERILRVVSAGLAAREGKEISGVPAPFAAGPAIMSAGQTAPFHPAAARFYQARSSITPKP